jgi:hypothetical protein
MATENDSPAPEEDVTDQLSGLFDNLDEITIHHRHLIEFAIKDRQIVRHLIAKTQEDRESLIGLSQTLTTTVRELKTTLNSYVDTKVTQTMKDSVNAQLKIAAEQITANTSDRLSGMMNQLQRRVSEAEKTMSALSFGPLVLVGAVLCVGGLGFYLGYHFR